MPFRILLSPEAEHVLGKLPPRRALTLRENLVRRLEEVTRLLALRRFGDEAQAEVFRVRVGSYEAQYTVDRGASTVVLHELVRLPSTRLPSSVG
jgi:mRNA-degrading endonuclease RelE of RelBE toxin-antitoxin system